MIDTIIQTVLIIIALAPLIVSGGTYLAQKTHNAKMINFLKRVQIAVDALNATDLAGKDKQAAAVAKGLTYAKEIGFTITKDQVTDYVEAAVKVMKAEEGLSNGSKEEGTSDPETK